MSGKLYTFEELYSVFTQELEKQNFNKSPKELYDPIIYTLAQSGKRLRPILMLMACNLFDCDIKKAMSQAIAIELLHNFTLIHDDIMDEAPVRHGQETVHMKWNKNLAILAGDTMYALAYKYVLNADLDTLPLLLQTFSNTALEACEGQQMDINFEEKSIVSLDDYLLMIKYKTAVLFGASMRIGGIIARAQEKDIEHLYQYGLNIGMAFQLKDDLLDIYGQTANFGKKKGIDILTGKKTFLYIKALEVADEKTKTTLINTYNKDFPLKEQKIDFIKALFDQLKIEDITNYTIDKYLNQGLYHLNHVNKPKENKVMLENLAKKLMYREK